GTAQHRFGTGQGGVGVDELGGRIDRAAGFTRVAVLVFGVAVRAFALDVAVWQEHALDRVVELLDRLAVDEAGLFQAGVDLLGEFDVLGRMGGMPVVEGDVKAIQILGTFGGVPGHELFRRDAFRLCLEHDGRAVRVVSAPEVHGVPRHPPGPYPDSGLDLFHDAADAE